MSKRKIFLVIFIVEVILFNSFNLMLVKADNGLDKVSSGGLGNNYLGIIVFFFVIFVIFMGNSQFKERSEDRKSLSLGANKFNSHRELTKWEIVELDSSIDKKKLYPELFDIYVNVQESWMNFDYDGLRKYTTDELYNMYESQMKDLRAKKQRNIISNIVCRSTELMSIDIENGIERIKVYLNVSQYDYVVDSNNKVVRGTSKYKNMVEYIIVFTRNVEGLDVLKCPNCGANVRIVSGNCCPYCDSMIINSADKFVMSKKECINQWRIKR